MACVVILTCLEEWVNGAISSTWGKADNLVASREGKSQQLQTLGQKLGIWGKVEYIGFPWLPETLKPLNQLISSTIEFAHEEDATTNDCACFLNVL